MRLVVLGFVTALAWPLPSGAEDAMELAPPLPERNPMRTTAPVAAKPPAPGELPTMPWTEAEVSAAKEECRALLAALTLDYQPLAPIKEGVCGAPAPILVRSIGKEPKVEIDPPATLTCPLAKALSTWLSETVQPEAKALLGSAVVGLHNATSYACRNRYGSAVTPLSEHALANALDVSEFTLASGGRVTVLDGWPKMVATPPAPLPNPVRDETATNTAATEPVKGAAAIPSGITAAKAEPAALPSPPPVAAEAAAAPDPKSQFLRQVHGEACHEFGTVLGPEANDAHKDHFHFDMKKRRSGFCQ